MNNKLRTPKGHGGIPLTHSNTPTGYGWGGIYQYTYVGGVVFMTIPMEKKLR